MNIPEEKQDEAEELGVAVEMLMNLIADNLDGVEVVVLGVQRNGIGVVTGASMEGVNPNAMIRNIKERIDEEFKTGAARAESSE